MKKNKFISGFSLVEILIALGLLSAITVGIMHIMEKGNKTAKTLQQKDDLLQITQEMVSTLSSERNCTSSFAGAKAGDTINIIKKVANNILEPKYYTNQEIGNTGVQIESIKVNSIDLNGTDGSHAQAVVDVFFKRLKSNTFGGRDLKRQIKMSANVCKKDLILRPSLNLLQPSCMGAGKKIVGGLKSWAGQFWAICQDCSVVNSASLKMETCQASGAAGGVDTGDVSKLSCLNMGGVFDDATFSCNFDGQNLGTIIASLQSQIEAAKLRECKLEDKINILTGYFNKPNACGSTPNVPKITKTRSWTVSGTLNLSQNFIDGTLKVKVIGGGGGGSSSDGKFNGEDGKDSNETQSSMTNITKGTICTVSVGAGGSPGNFSGSQFMGLNFSSNGHNGFPSFINCNSTNVFSTGGQGGIGSTGGNCSSYYYGNDPQMANGADGTTPGQGGKAGKCIWKGISWFGSSVRGSGGRGADGKVEATWEEYDISGF